VNELPPGFEDIRAAAVRIAPHVQRTPLLRSGELSRLMGVDVHLKCENFQAAGAFKSRGACNAVFSLSDAEAARGVATHSSGNHAAALARAAQRRGIPAWVVMPRNAAGVKRAAVAAFGAEIIDSEPTLAGREQTAAAVVARTGAAFVHPYDDARVIAGQGTAILELQADGIAPALVLTPVGGGGLLSGTAIAVRALWPAASVVGAEPAGADDAARSWASGRLVHQADPRTIADGLRGELSERTFALIRSYVSDIVTVSEAGILEAMQRVWRELGILIEPSSAVPVAALLEGRVRAPAGPVVVVISGGNVDAAMAPWASGPSGTRSAAPARRRRYP
jgi:threonine dehydratase